MKRIIALLAGLMLLLCGCNSAFFGGVSERTPPGSEAQTPPPVPPSGDVVPGGQVRATMYYRYKSEPYMAAMVADLLPTANKGVEQMIVERLIAGPGAEYQDLAQTIHRDTKVLSVSEHHGFLSITLSAEFLLSPDGSSEMGQEYLLQRRMAAYSIVNSITELGLHSRILLLVDTMGTGEGERISRIQAGLETQEEQPIEPLLRDTQLIFTAEKTLELSLAAYRQKDWETLNSLIAVRDVDGTESPGRENLPERLANRMTLLEYTVQGGITVLPDGSQATMNVDCTFADAQGQPQIYKSLPVRLVRDSEIWHVAYPSLDAMLPQL